MSFDPPPALASPPAPSPVLGSDDASPNYPSSDLSNIPPCRTSVIELVSISATSSAFPETFGLTVSSKGRWIVAYSSAALYILLAEELPTFRDVCRAFRIRRKPLAVAITDVGKYAVLTSSYKIDVYECGDGSGSAESLHGINRKVQTILLNNEARTIAFSSDGEMVAAGSEAGIEMVGLGMGTGLDRRQINCGSVETVVFSNDGKSLLATAPARKSRFSTFLTISGNFDQGFLEDDYEEVQQSTGRQWISQLLFPEKIAARQAVFLPDPGNTHTNDLLAYCPMTEQFGILDTATKGFNGKMLGIPDDVTWSRSQRYEDALPAVSTNGHYIATAVRLKESSEIWTYEVSEDWREEDESATFGGQSSRVELAPNKRLMLPPRLDQAPSETVTCMKWMQHAEDTAERLLALVNTVNLSMPEDVVPTVSPATSGKLIIFDFKESETNLTQEGLQNITINLDEFSLTEDLADEDVDIEREVDIVRRRTQAQRTQPRQRESGPVAPSREPRLRRSLSSSNRNSGAFIGAVEPNLHSTQPRRRRSFSSVSDVSEDTENGAPVVPVDEPYSQSAPRSQFMLNRAATVAQNSPAGRLHLRALPTQPLQYRRADGRPEGSARNIPHESDADDWMPPPPPYSERPDQPGPNAMSLAVPEAVRAAVMQGDHLRRHQQRQSVSHNNGHAARMQSRVSQIVSSVQIPVLSSHSRRNSREIRNPPRPTQPSTGNRSVSAQQISQQSNSYISAPTRRPSSTIAQVEGLRLNTTFTNVSPDPQSFSALDPPIIPGISTVMTFPGGRSSRQSSNAHLHAPNIHSNSYATSAPVTPVVGDRPVTQYAQVSQAYTETSSSANTQASAQPSTFDMAPPPIIPAAQNRRVISMDMMRSNPSTPAGNYNRYSNESTGHSQLSPSRTPSLSRLSTLITSQPQELPATPSSRRARWRMGNTPTSSNTPHAPATSFPMTETPLYRTPSTEEKRSKCVIQ